MLIINHKLEIYLIKIRSFLILTHTNNLINIIRICKLIKIIRFNKTIKIVKTNKIFKKNRITNNNKQSQNKECYKKHKKKHFLQKVN